MLIYSSHGVVVFDSGLETSLINNFVKKVFNSTGYSTESQF